MTPIIRQGGYYADDTGRTHGPMRPSGSRTHIWQSPDGTLWNVFGEMKSTDRHPAPRTLRYEVGFDANLPAPCNTTDPTPETDPPATCLGYLLIAAGAIFGAIGGHILWSLLR